MKHNFLRYPGVFLAFYIVLFGGLGVALSFFGYEISGTLGFFIAPLAGFCAGKLYIHDKGYFPTHRDTGKFLLLCLPMIAVGIFLFHDSYDPSFGGIAPKITSSNVGIAAFFVMCIGLYTALLAAGFLFGARGAVKHKDVM